MQYDFIILTPTHNRSELLGEVCKHLRSEADRLGVQVLHFVLDDCSKACHPYETLAPTWEGDGYKVKVLRSEKNHGRFEHYVVWNMLMAAARAEWWKLAIAIPDDDILCREFLRRSKALFLHEKRIDPRVCCMNLAAVNLTNWRMDRWVDGAFICDRYFFEEIKWDCSPPKDWFGERGPSEWQRDRGIESFGWGAGWVMSRKMALSKKKKIAVVNDLSLIKPQEVPSAMFPEDKFPNRPMVWGRSNFIDG